MADRLAHLANLAIAALVDGDAQGGVPIVAFPRQQLDLGRGRQAVTP
jgi:hypothetical protein